MVICALSGRSDSFLREAESWYRIGSTPPGTTQGREKHDGGASLCRWTSRGALDSARGTRKGIGEVVSGDVGHQSTQRILIADDDPTIRALLSRVLEDKGYTVETATDGRDALETITASPPDLLITDLIMPGLTGWSVLARARRQAPVLPIIIISGTDPTVRHREPSFPAITVFLRKPIAIEHLLAVVARLLTGVGPDSGTMPV